jgi:hypothetical protein
MLRFTNPGEIDPRLITTLGVNVKENGTPIGYFGTGLKYAIAGVLRSGGQVEIHSGERVFEFTCEAVMIRGKEFQFIYMNGTALGFTTDLGKNWEPWMWYREFASNTKDEDGEVMQVDAAGVPTTNETNIYVTRLDDEWVKRDQLFLNGTPIFIGKGYAEIYHSSKGPNAIYYRGVKIALPEKPAAFRYNLTCKMDLTEDRTFRSMWEARSNISLAIMQLQDEELLEQILVAREDTYEAMIDFNWSHENEVLDRTISRLMKTRLHEVNTSAVARMEAKYGQVCPEPSKMTRHEESMLYEAKEFLAEQLGINITVPVHVTESLGQDVHGLAWKREIYLSRLAFEQGIDWLAVVLIEEWCHAERRMGDYSRELQTWLLQKIVSTARGVEEASK